MENIYSIKVVFGDTDAAGIVFYPNYYRWMDQATHELIGKAVMPVSRLQSEENIVLPLLEASCQFRQPLHFEDKVEVHSEVIELKSKVLKIKHAFKKEGQLIAEGYETRAWASLTNGSIAAVNIPNAVRNVLENQQKEIV
ncbi:acyl-CoA thioesterase [Domibacillus robiginosus]|uniref:acyl-CoA thioesterase n=1 Tax=Domibacillus robiginosus TaxID=1071054 RepID=UPI00067B222D|nr:thioesterase family protein [Domibacillus robiginosus]